MNTPSILTANTYFWKPSASASGRRANEKKRLSEVASFFTSAGFEVETLSEKVLAKKDSLEVVFEYAESCKNVYKALGVYVNGAKKDIRALKKVLA